MSKNVDVELEEDSISIPETIEQNDTADPDSRGFAFSSFLEGQIKCRNLSIRKFASNIGVSENALYYIINSINLPTIQVLLKLANELNIDPYTLFQMCRREKVKGYVEKSRELFNRYKNDPSIQLPPVVFTNNRIEYPNLLQNTGVPNDYSDSRRELLFGNLRTPNFGKLIKEQRKTKKILQSDINAAMGKKYNYLSQLETGDVVPSIPTIFKLAAALKMDPLFLFNSLVAEKVEKYDRAYCNEYNFYRHKDASYLEKKKIRRYFRYQKLRQTYITLTSNLLVCLRKKRDLSRPKLASLLDVSSEEISNIESGEVLLSFDKIFQYADFFGLDKEKLFDITLQDRINLYRHKHEIGLKNYSDGGQGYLYLSYLFLSRTW